MAKKATKKEAETVKLCTEVAYFIRLIRKPAPALMRFLFQNGGCFCFYKILKDRFPSAEPRWSEDRNHVLTRIAGTDWDIIGEYEERTIRMTAKEEIRAAAFHFDEVYVLTERLGDILGVKIE